MTKRAITAIKTGPIFTTYPGANLPAPAERSKFSRLWRSLTLAQRETVEGVIRRHIAACKSNEVKIEKYELARVAIEACEMAAAGTLADASAVQVVETGPRRAYDVYVSPRGE